MHILLYFFSSLIEKLQKENLKLTEDLRFAYSIQSKSALHQAAQEGNIEAIRLLLQYGAKIDRLNDVRTKTEKKTLK
jgi:ankyrin repeat protein